MRIRNRWEEIPRDSNGSPVDRWWVVEEEPGIAVAGEDGVYEYDDEADAERMAENLALQTSEILTVVEYFRAERSSYQRRTQVVKL